MMYQKYIFKIDNKQLFSNKHVIANNLSQNPDLLRIELNNDEGFAYFGSYKVAIQIIFHENFQNNSQRFPTGIVKVTCSDILELEEFDKIFRQIAHTEQRFKKFNCIYDGISEYYSTKIYADLHKIERKTRELLKELFYLSDDSGELKEHQASIDEMDGQDFTFNKLIDKIFQKDARESDDLLEYIQNCIETNTVPNEEILPKSLWEKLLGRLEKEKSQGSTINELLTNIRHIRNTVAHCHKFVRNQYDDCEQKVKELSQQIDRIIESMEKLSLSDDISKDIIRLSNHIQSDGDDLKRSYFTEFELFEKDVIARFGSGHLSDEYKERYRFYHELDSKTDDEITVEIEKLADINNVDNLSSRVDINKVDDLTIIVPAQEEGFNEAFLGQSEWYDIRIGKTKRNKIKYIAAYEVLPIGGVRYWAKVKKIVPSDNKLGYWKIIFDGEAKQYPSAKELGATYAPQNSRYVSKADLDACQELSEVF